MRRLTITLLAACLLSASAIPVIAQQSSAPPWFGERVEMPEHGFAVTFPSDWTVRRVSREEHERFWTMTPEEMGQTLVLIASPKQELDYWFVDIGLGELHPVCWVMDETPRAEEYSGWTTADEVLENYHYGVTESPLVLELAAQSMDLPASRAVRVDIDWAPRSASGRREGERETTYHLTDGDSWFQLRCWSFEPPDDDWLSIAQTFEFLPAEE